MSEILIYALLERLGNLLRGEERLRGAEHGLQPVHIHALHYLSRCNRFSDTPASVTEYLGATKGTVSQTLQVLEKKGLIVKQPDEEDKRQIHLHISAAGRRLIGKLTPPELLNNVVKGLSKSERESLEQPLENLLLLLQAENGLRSFGECQTCRYNEQAEGQYRCGLTQLPLRQKEIVLICREHEVKVP